MLHTITRHACGKNALTTTKVETSLAHLTKLRFRDIFRLFEGHLFAGVLPLVTQDALLELFVFILSANRFAHVTLQFGLRTSGLLRDIPRQGLHITELAARTV